MLGYVSCLTQKHGGITRISPACISLTSMMVSSVSVPPVPLIQQKNCLGFSNSNIFPETPGKRQRVVREVCSQYTSCFYGALLVKCLSWAAGIVLHGAKDPSFFSQVFACIVGCRLEGEAQYHSLLLINHVCPTAFLPRIFFRNHKRSKLKGNQILLCFLTKLKRKK